MVTIFTVVMRYKINLANDLNTDVRMVVINSNAGHSFDIRGECLQVHVIDEVKKVISLNLSELLWIDVGQEV